MSDFECDYNAMIEFAKSVAYKNMLKKMLGQAKDTELIDILLKNGCPAEVLFNSIVEYGERLNGNKE